MLVFFESLYGPYPFNSYGAIVDDDSVGYALETQTRSFFSRNAREGTIAHELAHQWMGDHVSPYRWADIWLNEGWASYSEWMWTEHRGGASAQESFDDVDVDPGRRRGVLGRRRRRPGPARTLPEPDLRPRCGHPPRAPRGGRRRGVLRDRPGLGRALRRRAPPPRRTSSRSPRRSRARTSRTSSRCGSTRPRSPSAGSRDPVSVPTTAPWRRRRRHGRRMPRHRRRRLVGFGGRHLAVAGTHGRGRRGGCRGGAARGIRGLAVAHRTRGSLGRRGGRPGDRGHRGVNAEQVARAVGVRRLGR